MTDRKQALTELLEKVEVGGILAGDDWAVDYRESVAYAIMCEDAYYGSLDAAKAMHEAVLPGWACALNTNGGAQLIGPAPDWKRHTGLSENNPARAWLIAIFKALIAKET